MNNYPCTQRSSASALIVFSLILNQGQGWKTEKKDALEGGFKETGRELAIIALSKKADQAKQCSA